MKLQQIISCVASAACVCWTYCPVDSESWHNAKCNMFMLSWINSPLTAQPSAVTTTWLDVSSTGIRHKHKASSVIVQQMEDSFHTHSSWDVSFVIL